jgi:hypothetical protein
MALSDGEKTDVRRHCGYPVIGSATLQVLAWPLSQGRGVLEYRMNALSSSEETVLRRYLMTLLVLECAVPKSGEHLDTDQAAVWTRNRTEQEDRLRLLDNWRRRLCSFLGVTPGPGLPPSGSISVVV